MEMQGNIKVMEQLTNTNIQTWLKSIIQEAETQPSNDKIIDVLFKADMIPQCSHLLSCYQNDTLVTAKLFEELNKKPTWKTAQTLTYQLNQASHNYYKYYDDYKQEFREVTHTDVKGTIYQFKQLLKGV